MRYAVDWHHHGILGGPRTSTQEFKSKKLANAVAGTLLTLPRTISVCVRPGSKRCLTLKQILC